METIRINSPLLSQYVTKHVRVLGKVTETNSTQTILDANGPVTIHLESSSDYEIGDWIDVVGIVTDDLSIRALQCYSTNQKDLKAEIVGEMVNMWHKFPQLFHS